MVPAQLCKTDREGAEGTVTPLPSLLPQVVGQVMSQCPCITSVSVGFCCWRCQSCLGIVKVKKKERVARGHQGIMASCSASMHTDMLQCQAPHAAVPQHQVRGDINFSPAMAGTGSRAEQHPGCLFGHHQLQSTEEATVGQ